LPVSSQYSLMERFIMVFLPIRMMLSGRRACEQVYSRAGRPGHCRDSYRVLLESALTVCWTYHAQ
jgi:hypothetical protein